MKRISAVSATLIMVMISITSLFVPAIESPLAYQQQQADSSIPRPNIEWWDECLGSNTSVTIPARIVRDKGIDAPDKSAGIQADIIDNGGFFGLGRKASADILPITNDSSIRFTALNIHWEAVYADKVTTTFTYSGTSIQIDKKDKGRYNAVYGIENNRNQLYISATSDSEFRLRIYSATYTAQIRNHKPSPWISIIEIPGTENTLTIAYGGLDPDNVLGTFSPYKTHAQVQIELYKNDNLFKTELLSTTFDTLQRPSRITYRDECAGGETIRARIRIHDGLDWSDWDNSNVVLIPHRAIPQLSAQFSNRAIRVSWTISIPDSEINQYELQRSVNGTAFVSIANLTNAQTMFVDNNISAGTTYSYRARSRTWAWSEFCNPVSVQTPHIGGFEVTFDSNCWWAFGVIHTTRSQITARIAIQPDEWLTKLQDVELQIGGATYSLSNLDNYNARIVLELPTESRYTLAVSMRTRGTVINNSYQIERIPPLYGTHRIDAEGVRGDIFIATTTNARFNIEINRDYAQIDWSESFIRFYDRVTYYSLNSFFKNKFGIINESIQLPITTDQLYYVDFLFRFTGAEIYVGTSEFYVDTAAPIITSALARVTDLEFRLTEQFPASATYRLVGSNGASREQPIQLRQGAYNGELITTSYPMEILQLLSELQNPQLIISVTDRAGRETQTSMSVPVPPPVSTITGIGTLPSIRFVENNGTINISDSQQLYFRVTNAQLRSVSVYLNSFLYNTATVSGDSIAIPLAITEGTHTVEIVGRTSDYRTTRVSFTAQSRNQLNITAFAAVRWINNNSDAAIRWTPIPNALQYRICIADPSNHAIPDYTINASDNSNAELIVPLSEFRSLANCTEGIITVVAITEQEPIVMNARYSIPIPESPPESEPTLLDYIEHPSFRYAAVVLIVVVATIINRSSKRGNRTPLAAMQNAATTIRDVRDKAIQGREKVQDLVQGLDMHSIEIQPAIPTARATPADIVSARLGGAQLGFLTESDLHELLESEANRHHE